MSTTIDLEKLIGDDEPTQLVVVDSDTPHMSVALAVTREKGLEVSVLDHRAQFREERRAAPARIEGVRSVSELMSFLDELARLPLEKGTSTLWGDYTKGRVIAIYNDHSTAAPGHRDDRLVLQMIEDDDWKAWHAISGKYFGQEEFGAKIEELRHTVLEPNQAELLEVIDSVRASTKAEFESSIERSNGSQAIAFKHTVTTRAGRTGQLKVPQVITLSLRPWEGHHEVYEVPAYFRLRADNGALALCIQLQPTRQIQRGAWADVVNKIVDNVDIPVLAQRNAQ